MSFLGEFMGLIKNYLIFGLWIFILSGVLAWLMEKMLGEESAAVIFFTALGLLPIGILSNTVYVIVPNLFIPFIFVLVLSVTWLFWIISRSEEFIRYWIALKRTAEQLWKKVKQFWRRM